MTVAGTGTMELPWTVRLVLTCAKLDDPVRTNNAHITAIRAQERSPIRSDTGEMYTFMLESLLVAESGSRGEPAEYSKSQC